MANYTTFKSVPIGTAFIANGNICTKVSSRTAVLVQYMRTLSFAPDQPVEIV